jgi:hypothetical protein
MTNNILTLKFEINKDYLHDFSYIIVENKKEGIRVFHKKIEMWEFIKKMHIFIGVDKLHVLKSFEKILQGEEILISPGQKHLEYHDKVTWKFWPLNNDFIKAIENGNIKSSILDEMIGYHDSEISDIFHMLPLGDKDE